MAGRIPVYRRVGDVLPMRPGKADRGICTPCHEMPFKSPPPAAAQLSERAERGGFGPCITSRQSASARIQRSYRRGTRPDRNRARCSVRHGHRCLCGTSPARVVREEWPARAEELCCTFRAAHQSGNYRLSSWSKRVFPTGRSAASPTRMIRRGVHKSVQAPETSIRAWIENWNQDQRPFTWTKTAEEILGSLAKLIPTSGTGHWPVVGELHRGMNRSSKRRSICRHRVE
jgi:hypothetical protein